MIFQILMPAKTIIGDGAIEAAGEAIKKLGDNALIISGKIVEKNGIVDKLKAGS